MLEFLTNSSGDIDFAQFPEIKHRLWHFEAAPVRLQRGNESWGATHIQKFHAHEFLALSVESFVALILKIGVPVHCEFEGLKGEQKALAVNARAGTAVVQYKRTKQGNFYTVITAFARRRPRGEKIGVLQ